MFEHLNEKLVNEIFEKANQDYINLHNKNITIRWGQTLWNTAEDYIRENCSPAVVDKLRDLKGSDYDCFYDDQKTVLFIKKLKEL